MLLPLGVVLWVDEKSVALIFVGNANHECNYSDIMGNSKLLLILLE